jgi:large subunit ribosomal protein L4e
MIAYLFYNVELPRNKEKRFSQKKNPLKNLNVMLRLNPYAKTFRRKQLLFQMERQKARAEAADKKRGLKK